MSAQLIDGKATAQKVRERVTQQVAERRREGKRVPGLAVVLVGDDAASEVYVRNKHRACEQAGIISFQHKLPADTSQHALETLIDELNADTSVDGILLPPAT